MSQELEKFSPEEVARLVRLRELFGVPRKEIQLPYFRILPILSAYGKSDSFQKNDFEIIGENYHLSKTFDIGKKQISAEVSSRHCDGVLQVGEVKLYEYSDTGGDTDNPSFVETVMTLEPSGDFSIYRLEAEVTGNTVLTEYSTKQGSDLIQGFSNLEAKKIVRDFCDIFVAVNDNFTR